MPKSKAVKRELDDEGLEYAKKAKMTEMPLDQKKKQGQTCRKCQKRLSKTEWHK